MRTETKGKEQYEVPRIEILEIVNEGIICASGNDETATVSDFMDGGTFGDDFIDFWGN